MKIISIPLALLSLTISSIAQDMKMIESEALKKWPDKKEMQEYVIKTEVEAFSKIEKFQTDKVVDRQSLKWLKEMAAEKWPKSYAMQEFLIKREIKAGHGLANFKKPEGMTAAVFDGIFDGSVEKWEEWSMILFRVEAQIKAWNELRELEMLNGAKGKAAVKEGEKKWRGDYTMQLYVAKKVLNK